MPRQPSMLPKQRPDLNEQIAEIERELAMRRSVYPRWIDNGRIDEDVADHRIACLEETLAALRELHGLDAVEFGK